MNKKYSMFLMATLLVAETTISSAVAARNLEGEFDDFASSKNPGAFVPGFGPGFDPGFQGFEPGPGFNFPGFGGNGGGGFNFPGFPEFGPGTGGAWGAGYGGPGGGYTAGGVEPPSVVCSERGPCYKKRVTCPDKCFTTYSHSGKGYGYGGGGGGCTIDCTKHCVGYC